MSERIPHPSRDELQAFALGQLDDDASGVVAEHLGQCEPCEVTLATLADAGDTLVAALRVKAAPAPFEQEPELSAVLNRASVVATQAALEESGVAVPGESVLGGTSEAKAADADADEKLPFSVIRDYQLLEKLGAGGMGAVYKALHTQLDKVVAIKLLPPERTQDAAAVARFRREMKAVGKLDHPHIVRALDAGQHEGRHFLVIEHVQGEDLSKIARRLERLPIPEACEVVRQAALGLQHAYEHGLVHRDIKPSNLMLSVARSRRERGVAPTVPTASTSESALGESGLVRL